MILNTFLQSSFVALLCQQAWAHPAQNVRRPSPIQLPTGQYEGLHDASTSTIVFYAVPYAFAERFKASQSIETKPSISAHRKVNASSHGAACVNFKLPPPYDRGFEYFLGPEPIQPQSEDCLSMDIYVPDGDYRDLPVLFYTPGGGFLVGSSFQYDMRPLVQRGAAIGTPFIAVVVNYRLGPLGFLNPSTTNDGNVGILDQFQALNYTKKYIANFGGDPSKVTIMGQSAGGESTMYQLLWADESLFRAAWLVSVPSAGAPFLRTEPKGKDDLIRQYAKACGCPNTETLQPSIDCLTTTDVRTLSNASVAWAGSGSSFSGFINENVFQKIRAGHYPRVPIVISVCRDEGTSTAIGFNASNDATTKIAVEGNAHWFRRSFDEAQSERIVQQMLEAYPNDPTLGCPYDGLNTTYGQPSQYKRMSAIWTDITYTEAWTEYLKTFSENNEVWGILWDEVIPGPGADPTFGVVHGSDIPYYFPTLLGPNNDTRSKDQDHLVQILQTALINFVVDGEPNGVRPSGGRKDCYRWPEFGHERRITRLNAAEGRVSEALPHRPGFDVIRKAFRPNGF